MVLDYFKMISKIPRGSYNCKGISDYLVGFAKEHGLRYYQDEAYNVVIYKDATPGYENCSPLILQGHMDMVCEKVSESDHDFFKDEIEVILDGDTLRANGTTLGADDGIAVAYMLDILADESISHPALEMLITADEEVGMVGAMALDPSALKGRCMINLDSEEEGIFVAACAGGIDSHFRLDIKNETVSGVDCTIKVSGLLGGHSGTDIDKLRTNAVLLLNRVLSDLGSIDYHVVSMKGGNKDNVIPSEAVAKLVIDKADLERFAETLYNSRTALINELQTTEPGLVIDIATGSEGEYEVIATSDQKRIASFLNVLPNGVLEMSGDIPGMVESSCNLGIFRLSTDGCDATVSARSQKESYKYYIANRLESLAHLVGASFYTDGEYPGWDIKPQSDFRDMLCSVYKEMYGSEPVVSSIHAGLEGGVLSGKIPDMDIVSLGPDAMDVHTVNEHMDINSVNRVYEYLRKVIETYGKPV